MSIFSLNLLINTISVGLLGVFVCLKNYKNNINRKYALFCFFVTCWSFSYFMWSVSYSKESALFWSHGLIIGAVLIPVSFLHFVYSILYKTESIIRKRIILLSYTIFSIFLLLGFTPIFIRGVASKLSFQFWPKAGMAFYPFIILWFLYCIYAVYLLLVEYKNSVGLKREQIKYVTVGIAIGYLGGATNYFLWFDIPLFPFGNPLIPLSVAFMAYAIVRYRLMDIKVAVTRTGIFIAVYTLVLGLPFAVAVWFKGWFIGSFGANWWMLPLGLMAVLATIGPFIYIYIGRKAEDRLLKEQRRYQDTLKQASVGMTRIRNLRKLLDLIAHIVTKTVHISYAGIYLYNEETEEYVLQVARDKGRTPIAKITSGNPLMAWLTQNREPLIYDEVKLHMQHTPDKTYKDLEENMRLLTASVIIPCFLEDTLLGLFVFGDKISGQIYTPDDLNVFQVLASQAALAIENAQFYEETKEMQEQVAQAEKMATVGTMADGLSHQINNRFYALSLIAGDTIDTIKMTDTSKCAPEIKEMIEQINHALGRIQSNVIQGGEVVKGILKYTRKGEEGFSAITLDQVLDGTLEMVQYKVKLSEIDLVRNYPKDIPNIKGNLVQLEEAFFNFIDNAYDSTVERKTILQEPGYKGRITISAFPKDGKLEIVIEDNGMGIKDDNVKKVFTPFFTTKTSSRRGTGLGLYVIRRIITDTHKGKILFESAYKVGTRFIIELPVAS